MILKLWVTVFDLETATVKAFFTFVKQICELICVSVKVLLYFVSIICLFGILSYALWRNSCAHKTLDTGPDVYTLILFHLLILSENIKCELYF